MKMIRIKTAFLVCSLFSMSFFAACGSAGSAKSEQNDYALATAATEGAYYEESGYAAEAEEAIEEEAAGGASLQTPEKLYDKLIYSGFLHLQTLEYDKSIKSIHDKINAAKGFIQSENETDNNYDWYYYNKSSKATRNADIRARIPAESFQSFMDSLEEDGQVMNRSVSADNITQTYRETEASVKAYEIEQERLLEMMDKAETIEDMIAVEARLSEVEAELGRYKTSLASMDRDVEYSTINITLEEVREYSEEVDDSTLASRLKETFKSSWKGFVSFLEGLLHLLIRLLPFILLALVIILIIRAWNKKFADKRLARKEARRQKKMQKMQIKQQKKQHRAGFYQQAPPPGGTPQDEPAQGMSESGAGMGGNEEGTTGTGSGPNGSDATRS